MRYCIGIDTGVNTGLAVWDRNERRFTDIATMTISKAMLYVLGLARTGDVEVFFEDARKRKWIPAMPDIRREMGRWQGSGSVMRDCKIWEDFCGESGIPCEAVAPQRNRTKLESRALREAERILGDGTPRWQVEDLGYAKMLEGFFTVCRAQEFDIVAELAALDRDTPAGERRFWS